MTQVGNQALTSKISPEDLRSKALYPGQSIQLAYHPEDVTWY